MVPDHLVRIAEGVWERHLADPDAPVNALIEDAFRSHVFRRVPRAILTEDDFAQVMGLLVGFAIRAHQPPDNHSDDDDDQGDADRAQ